MKIALIILLVIWIVSGLVFLLLLIKGVAVPKWLVKTYLTMCFLFPFIYIVNKWLKK